MIFLHITFWVFSGLAMWWLSGFDSHVTGENRWNDFARRAARCLATVILTLVFFAPNAVRTGYVFVPLILIVPPTIGIMWAGCAAALLAQFIHRMIDSDDRQPFDPNENARNLDRVASLLKSGRHKEAAQLSEKLKASGGANILVLETMLARAGVPHESSRKPPPLAGVLRLRSEGKFDEAETVLKSLLAENPSNMDAVLMLMRLYAWDLGQPGKAGEVLRALKKQPHIPSAYIEYAQRSIHEWGRGTPPLAAEVLPESVDELLACGYLGTAIEMLEQKTREQPRDFDLWLKLAEAHGLHSGNIHRAEKIVHFMESKHGFSAEQIQIAKARLKEWRETKPQRN
jgi:tetratricopeptide (TPR) repeat protein